MTLSLQRNRLSALRELLAAESHYPLYFQLTESVRNIRETCTWYAEKNGSISGTQRLETGTTGSGNRS